MRIPSRYEVRQCIKRVDPRMKLLVGLIYGSGLSSDEVSELRPDQVDIDSMTISVNGRTTIIPDSVKSEVMAAIDGVDKSDTIFKGSRGGAINRQLKRALLNLSQVVGVRITSGTLRKAFALHALENGCNREKVLAASGYKPRSFYLLLPKIQNKEADKLSSPLDVLPD